jgi:hypothetical protein
MEFQDINTLLIIYYSIDRCKSKPQIVFNTEKRVLVHKGKSAADSKPRIFSHIWGFLSAVGVAIKFQNPKSTCGSMEIRFVLKMQP